MSGGGLWSAATRGPRQRAAGAGRRWTAWLWTGCRWTAWRWARTAAVAAALVAVPACGGSGGGGGGGSPTPPPPAGGITFTPAGNPAGAAVVLTRQGNDPNTLVLTVEARSVSDLYGVAFDLAYPSQALTFEGATEGGFLGGGTATTSLQVAEQQGRLVVGLTRLGAVSGSSGSGTLLTLSFRAVAAGNGALSFSANQGIASNGAPLALDWLGGSVQVTR